MRLIKPKDEKFFGWLCGLMSLVKLANYFHIIKQPQTCFREGNRKQDIIMENQQPFRNTVKSSFTPSKSRETSGHCCISSWLAQPSKPVNKGVVTQVPNKGTCTWASYYPKQKDVDWKWRKKNMIILPSLHLPLHTTSTTQPPKMIQATDFFNLWYESEVRSCQRKREINIYPFIEHK